MGSAGARRSKTTNTILGTFAVQLRALGETLRDSESQYVKCVKPNAHAAKGEWDAPFVARQLANMGIFEAARAARRGYDHRLDFPFLCARYRCCLDASAGGGASSGGPAGWLASHASPLRRLLGGGKTEEEELRARAAAICGSVLGAAAAAAGGGGVEYQIGRTKAFLSTRAVDALDARRRATRAAAATRIQARARGRRAAAARAAGVASAVAIQAAARARVARLRVASLAAARLEEALALVEIERLEAERSAAAQAEAEAEAAAARARGDARGSPARRSPRRPHRARHRKGITDDPLAGATPRERGAVVCCRGRADAHAADEARL